MLNLFFFSHYHDTYTLTVVTQFYQSEVNNEYVIRGNAAILKCSIPSFVADFVSVVAWNDDVGNSYTLAEGDAGSSAGGVHKFGVFALMSECVYSSVNCPRRAIPHPSIKWKWRRLIYVNYLIEIVLISCIII